MVYKWSGCKFTADRYAVYKWLGRKYSPSPQGEGLFRNGDRQMKKTGFYIIKDKLIHSDAAGRYGDIKEAEGAQIGFLCWWNNLHGASAM